MERTVTLLMPAGEKRPRRGLFRSAAAAPMPCSSGSWFDLSIASDAGHAVADSSCELLVQCLGGKVAARRGVEDNSVGQMGRAPWMLKVQPREVGQVKGEKDHGRGDEVERNGIGAEGGSNVARRRN